MPPEDFGDLFELKLYKSWGGRSNEQNWVNVYHFASGLNIAAAGWLDVINGIAAFEKGFHQNKVHYMRAVLSTMQKDPGDYPGNLKVYELAGTGTKGTLADQPPLDLNFALQFQKQLETGRSGRMLYRGVLTSSMVDMGPGGKMALRDTAGPVGDIVPLWQALQGVLNANAEQTRWVVPTRRDAAAEGGGTFVVRNVLGVKVSGVVLNKRNHKYFDKGGPSAGTGGDGAPAPV